jgi:hypothetical protein
MIPVVCSFSRDCLPLDQQSDDVIEFLVPMFPACSRSAAIEFDMVYTSIAVPVFQGERLCVQVIGLRLRTGRKHRAQNTTTKSLC